MSAVRYVFYDPTTGKLHPEVKTLDGVSIELNTPPGHKALAHQTAHPSHHRVELETGALVPLPQPTPDHVWNDKNGRWELGSAAAEHAATLRAARMELATLDLASIRPLRAIVLGSGSAADREKLTQIEQDAVAARAVLSGRASCPPERTETDALPALDQ